MVINQNFVPPQAQSSGARIHGRPAAQQQPDQSSGLKLYQAPPSHPYADAAAAQRASAGDKPTIYLIALRDHTIVQALGYWMEGSTLHYVSAEHTLNQLSIDLVDRDLSQRLNDERGAGFPAAAAALTGGVLAKELGVAFQEIVVAQPLARSPQDLLEVQILRFA